VRRIRQAVAPRWVVELMVYPWIEIRDWPNCRRLSRTWKIFPDTFRYEQGDQSRTDQDEQSSTP